MTDQDPKKKLEMPQWRIIAKVLFCSSFMLLAGSYAFGYRSHEYLRYFDLCIYMTLVVLVLMTLPFLMGAIPAGVLDRTRLEKFSIFWLRWYPLPLIACFLASLAYVKSFPSAGLVE